jgi:DNA polymerase III alpha subunit
VYVSCWLKRHEPAAFLAAMLNSQPMGHSLAGHRRQQVWDASALHTCATTVA